MPLVSVIMPVYNGEKYLAQAIDSILGQTFTDFELLIVDDGSQDRSAEIMQDYAERDQRIRCLQHPVNRSQSAALNTGIAAACGQYLTSMDSDDVSLPGRLMQQVEFLQLHPRIGMVGTCAHVMNHDMTSVIYDFEVPSEHASAVFTMFVGYGLLGATVMHRSEFLRAVGGYDSRQRRSGDLELFARLVHETPIRCANLDAKLYLYRRHDQPKFRSTSTDENIFERDVKKRNLMLLWNEAPEDTMDRLYRLRMRSKLSWAERRATKHDLKRLVDALIARRWVEPDDKPLLIDEMNRRLELASPRRWQQFMHWRRHRLGF